MIKITPRINYYNQQNMSNSHKVSPVQYAYSNNSNSPASPIVTKSSATSAPHWIKNGTILKALNHLKNLEFEEEDVRYVESLGAVLPFSKPKEALKFINDTNIRIKFCPLSSPHVHAQYDFDSNVIEINKIYEHTQNPAEILAISEAILHETGHAKDKDGVSSVQEEFDCLAMNALAHRVFSKKFPSVFETTDSLIVQDGACVYSDLFFDRDSGKEGLIKRLQKKYGDLPVGDYSHPPCEIAMQTKNSLI